MLNNTNGSLVVKTGTTGTTTILSAVNDRVVVDVEDLTHVEIWLNQLVNAGTATIVVEKSVDGTNWALVASKTDGDFRAQNNDAIVIPLEGTNGLPLHAKTVRATMTVEGSDGGSYSMVVSGRQLDKFA